MPRRARSRPWPARVTMPYAMSVLGAEMLRIYFSEDCATVGELLAAAKRAMITRPRDDERSQTIDALAKLLNPASQDLALERAEHLELFNLIGDPLLKLPCAAVVQVQAPRQIRSGEKLEISGTTPIDGEVEIELVVRRDRLTFRPTPRPSYANTPAARRISKDVQSGERHAACLASHKVHRRQVPRDARCAGHGER